MPVTVPLDRLETGMVLESDVCDRGGRMLLGRGSAITERHLRIFKAWGVTEALVRDTAHSSPGAGKGGGTGSRQGAKDQGAARQTAEKIFSHSNLDHPMVAKLFEMCLEKLAKQGG